VDTESAVTEEAARFTSFVVAASGLCREVPPVFVVGHGSVQSGALAQSDGPDPATVGTVVVGFGAGRLVGGLIEIGRPTERAVLCRRRDHTRRNWANGVC